MALRILEEERLARLARMAGPNLIGGVGPRLAIPSMGTGFARESWLTGGQDRVNQTPDYAGMHYRSGEMSGADRREYERRLLDIAAEQRRTAEATRRASELTQGRKQKLAELRVQHVKPELVKAKAAQDKWQAELKQEADLFKQQGKAVGSQEWLAMLDAKRQDAETAGDKAQELEILKTQNEMLKAQYNETLTRTRPTIDQTTTTRGQPSKTTQRMRPVGEAEVGTIPEPPTVGGTSEDRNANNIPDAEEARFQQALQAEAEFSELETPTPAQRANHERARAYKAQYLAKYKQAIATE